MEKLEENGLIRQEGSRDQARSRKIRLLPSGIDHLNIALKATKRVAGRLTDPLGPFLYRNLYEMADEYLSLLQREAALGHVKREHPLDIGILLSDALLTSSVSIRHLLRAHGLSLTESRILFELNEYSSGMHPSELAVRLLMPLPDLTVAIARLSGQGFVNVTRECFDKRATLVELNSNSFALICQVLPSIDRFYCEASAGFPPINRLFVLKTARLMSARQRKRFHY
jgi:DNA-binding MarR family transcriptional regulator